MNGKDAESKLGLTDGYQISQSPAFTEYQKIMNDLMIGTEGGLDGADEELREKLMQELTQLREKDGDRRSNILSLESGLKRTYITEKELPFLQMVYWGGKDKDILGCGVSGILENIHGVKGYESIGLIERMLHEATPTKVAQADVQSLVKVFEKLGIPVADRNVIETNTGLGGLTHALATSKSLHLLATVERNEEVAENMKMAWLACGLEFPFDMHLIDAGTFIKTHLRNGYYRDKKILAVVVDPPWERYRANGGKYNFEIFKPNGRRIITSYLGHVPIIAMKFPGNFDWEDANELSEKHQLQMHITINKVDLGLREYQEAFVIFVRRDFVSSHKIPSMREEQEMTL
jgi:hypothetical protein